MKKLFFSLLLFSSTTLMAADLDISNAQIRVLPPGTKVTSITFDVKNNSSSDVAIISVSGNFAKSFELHTMGMDNGKMEMKKADRIILPKKATTTFKKGGYHVMVFEPKEDIVEGKEYALTLFLENKKSLSVNVIGKKPFGEPKEEHHGHH